MLLIYELGDREWTPNEGKLWDKYLAAISFAIRATHNTTLGASPAELVFNRDMMVGTQHVANWRVIAARKQSIAEKNNQRENKGRIEYYYRVGDLILLDHKHRKLDAPYEGPYPIINLYSNGAVEVQKGNTLLKVNMRQLHPFWRRRMH